MEIGNEISHKIRSAIKAKLVELGAYEDEELPDYIMVMVANKKTHAQMNEDLHLFLGGSTEKFTSWLQTILNKLKSITIGNPPSVLNAVVGSAQMDPIDPDTNNNSNDDTGVPELLVQTDMDDFAEEQEENPVVLGGVGGSGGKSTSSSSVDMTSQLTAIHHPAATEHLKGNFNLGSQSSAVEITATTLPPQPQSQPYKVQSQPSTRYINPNLGSRVLSHLQQAINSNSKLQPSNITTSLSSSSLSSLGTGYSGSKTVPPRLQMDLIANYPEKQIPKAVTAPIISQAQTDVQLAKVHPQNNRKRRIPGSVIGSVIHHSSEEEEEDEEYDPLNPAFGSVASVVRVTERKSSIRPELQANKCLLLKAVKEAHKSLALQEKRNVERAMIKPMPHPVIPEKRIKMQSDKMQQPQKRLMLYSQSSQAKKTNSLYETDDPYEVRVCTIDDGRLKRVNEDSRLVECKSSRIAVLKQQISAAATSTIPSPLQGRLKPVHQDDDEDIRMEEDDDDNDNLRYSANCEPAAESSSNFETEETKSSSSISNFPRIVKDKKKRPTPKTQFIVTLDGYDESQQSKSSPSSVPFSSEVEPTHHHLSVPSSSSSKPSPFSISDSADEEDEDEEMMEEENSTNTPEKKSEKCKFWPSCQNGTNCKYQHPSVACSKFPACKFGDKCAYVHPKCKFDTKCSRFDCPFSHSHFRQSATTLAPAPATHLGAAAAPLPPPQPVAVPLVPPPKPAAAATRTPPPCRFFPSCKNMSCPFSHPKPCRFGISCTNKTFCTFYHPPLPNKKQLQWKAGKSILATGNSSNLVSDSHQMQFNLQQWNNNNPYKVVNAVNT